MLILSRRKNECIHIDQRILLKVVDISGDKVRLGIEAPKDVAVVRDDAKLQRAREAVAAGNIAQVRDQLDLEDNEL